MSHTTPFAAGSASPGPAPLRAPESPLRPLWQAASFSVLLYVGWMLLAALFHPRLEWLGGNPLALRLLLYYFCLDAFALALSAGYISGLDGESFRALGLCFESYWFRQAAVGVAWGAGVISATALLLLLVRAATFSYVASNSLPRLFLIAVFIFLAAAFEELTFRGYALQRLARALGPLAAVCVSSAIFGLAHSANPQATLLSTLNTVLAGVLLSASRLRSRALWMPIGLHFGWNLFLGPVLSFPVSGFAFGAIATGAPPAVPLWLTGGAYGPEGSAALTAALLLAIPLFLRLPLPIASLHSRSEVH